MIVVTGATLERAAEIHRAFEGGAAILNAWETVTVHNIGPGDVRAGQAVFRSGAKLVVRDASGRRLATLRPVQEAVVRPRRKLRRIGGSDRLWRALRGGR